MFERLIVCTHCILLYQKFFFLIKLYIQGEDCHFRQNVYSIAAGGLTMMTYKNENFIEIIH